MKRPSEVEDLATKAMDTYMEAAGCVSNEDIVNGLMMLLTVAGAGLVAAVGHPVAVGLLHALTHHIDTKLAGIDDVEEPCVTRH